MSACRATKVFAESRVSDEAMQLVCKIVGIERSCKEASDVVDNFLAGTINSESDCGAAGESSFTAKAGEVWFGEGGDQDVTLRYELVNVRAFTDKSHAGTQFQSCDEITEGCDIGLTTKGACEAVAERGRGFLWERTDEETMERRATFTKYAESM